MIDAKAYPETGGWFERKDVTHPFRNIIDVLLFASMGPPGGGRSFITPRMTGHLYLVGFPLLDDEPCLELASRCFVDRSRASFSERACQLSMRRRII